MSRFFAPFIIVLPVLLSAQQSILPPPAVNDGVVVYQAGLNAGSEHWGNPFGLGAYKISGNGYQKPVTPGIPDSQLGLVWNSSAPLPVGAARQSLQETGGILRVIYVGETAGWLNDFGYTRDGDISGSNAFTVWKDIQSCGKNKSVLFGDYFDVPVKAGHMYNLDLWFMSEGSWDRTSCKSENNGGIYTLLNSPGDPSQFLWADRSLAVNTWIPCLSTSLMIDTFLIGIEDWRMGHGADGDFNDFRFAVQFLNTDGTPLAVIPEPPLAGFVLGCAGIALAMRRRVWLGRSDKVN